MAEAKKKTTTGKRSSTAKRGSAKKSGKRPIRREIGGLITLLLALCVGVSYFSNEDAILINLLSVGLKGLVGYGYWLMLPALLAARDTAVLELLRLPEDFLLVEVFLFAGRSSSSRSKVSSCIWLACSLLRRWKNSYAESLSIS